MAKLISNTENETPKSEDNKENKSLDPNEKIVKNIDVTANGSVIDTLYVIKTGKDVALNKYKPLMFLLDMPYEEAKAWINKALEEYSSTFSRESDKHSSPIEHCFAVYKLRREKRAKAKAAKEQK